MSTQKGRAPQHTTDHWPILQEQLDTFLQTVSWLDIRQNDPIELVWQYPNPADQEVIALIAATLAYGRASLLTKATRVAVASLGPDPAQTLLHYQPQKHIQHLDNFVYRMTRGEDLLALFQAIHTTLQHYGSLFQLFCEKLEPQQEDYLIPLTHFVHTLRHYGNSQRRGFFYLLADPAQGGACKRLNLFLRWMIRGPDPIDTGLWNQLPTHKLVMPLDTHIVRISTYLGLTSRKTANWKMAKEIAQNLKNLSPQDPLRYDFALCHLGISGACPNKRDYAICQQCPIEAVCLLD